jgi:acyl-CoA synthetase (AMP-forming)/AMP-acid ligase II
MSIVNLLEKHCEKYPHKKIYHFLNPKLESTLSFIEILDNSKKISAHLHDLGIKQGDRVLIAVPQNPNYILAFWACLYAGVIAVPVYPPITARHVERMTLILKDADSQFIIAETATIEILQKHGKHPSLKTCIDIQKISSSKTHFTPPTIDEDSIAFLQYTSGSTSHPKGVLVKHSNLLANLKMIQENLELDEHSIIVCWLPFFHDMGLIGNVLLSAFSAIPLYFKTPTAFIRDPLFWLETISKYKATHTWGPNFAFDLCTKKSSFAKQDLNLSSLKYVTNAAEPIHLETLLSFNTAFEKYGFNPKAWLPGYGLAEATLCVTGGGNRKTGIKTINVNENAFQENKIIIDDSSPKKLVSHGKSVSPQKLLIVNPDNFCEQKAYNIGEIWLQGPHVTAGYWKKPELSEKTFNCYTNDTHIGPCLRTGDLGFLDQDGELYIVGRLKDLIIIHGKNYAPQDLEYTIEKSIPEINTNSVIAFSVATEQEEALVVVIGFHKDSLPVEESVFKTNMNVRLFAEHQITAKEIIIVNPKAIPKTTSGKLQRQRCKNQYLNRELER